jgi:hypothetical protein
MGTAHTQQKAGGKHIMPTTHFDRYEALMTQAAASDPSRTGSREYQAALYILASSETLFRFASPCVTGDGINFDEMIAAVLRGTYASSDLTAIQAAYNLFNWGGDTDVTPRDLSRCTFAVLDVIVSAIYVLKDGREITRGENGEIVLDATGEQRIRSFEAGFTRHLERVTK